jgi:hypothetical protein
VKLDRCCPRFEDISKNVHVSTVILLTPKAEIRRIAVQGRPRGKIVYESLSGKCPTQKRAGGVVQVVESLPSKREALSSKLRKEGKPKEIFQGVYNKSSCLCLSALLFLLMV